MASGKEPVSLSTERARAEALMYACIERLGAQSPAALMACDTYLAHDFWTHFVQPKPRGASQAWTWGETRDSRTLFGPHVDLPMPTEFVLMHKRRINVFTCKGGHMAVVVDSGRLWVTGSNYAGQLGLGDKNDRDSFTRVPAFRGTRVSVVACGDSHTLAVLKTGELFAWGGNMFGQLGIEDDAKRNMPTPKTVATLSGRRVVAIACGIAHSVAALETGELFVWGNNRNGQLGLGDTTNRIVPTQVTALAGKRIVVVACGGDHTAAITDTGELFTWGLNREGQLGHGNRARLTTPQRVEAFCDRPVAAVDCSGNGTLALLRSGEVFAWGYNEQGQLGIGECSTDPVCEPRQVHFFDDKRVRSVHAGGFHSAAVLQSGELFVWGWTGGGRYGSGKECNLIPMPIDILGRKHVVSVAFNGCHSIVVLTR